MLHFGKSVPHRLQGVCAAFAVMVTGDNVEHKPPRPVATKSVHLSTSDDDVIFAHSPLEIGCDFLRQLLFHLKPKCHPPRRLCKGENRRDSTVVVSYSVYSDTDLSREELLM